jgi:hypothetical protein
MRVRREKTVASTEPVLKQGWVRKRRETRASYAPRYILLHATALTTRRGEEGEAGKRYPLGRGCDASHKNSRVTVTLQDGGVLSFFCGSQAAALDWRAAISAAISAASGAKATTAQHLVSNDPAPLSETEHSVPEAELAVVEAIEVQHHRLTQTTRRVACLTTLPRPDRQVTTSEILGEMLSEGPVAALLPSVSHEACSAAG